MADRKYDRQELAHQLRLPPRTVRRLIGEYRDWLSQSAGQQFTALDLARLQIVARLELAGRPRAAIEAALVTTRSRAHGGDGANSEEPQAQAPAADGEVAATQAEAPLRAELVRLREVIEEGAARERQDRDRMLMALVRTQQEVSHLRSELGSYRSRHDRRRGLIRRLFG